MIGLTWADWAVIAVYIVGITFMGVWAARRVKSAADFFISDRHSGYLPMIFFSLGTGTHSDQAVGVAAAAYRYGASGIWYQWLWLFATPFYWLIAPIFRRTRAVTTADYFDARYDRSVGALYAVVGIIQNTVSIGVMLRGVGALIDAVTGGAISMEVAIWGSTAMFLIYGIAGGINAAILTDVVNGFLTIILSCLILPFALDAVGGLAGLREMVNSTAFFEVVAPGEIGAFYIAIVALNALVGWVTQPVSMPISAAGPTEMHGRVGVTGGNMIKRVCTIAWVLTGMIAVGLYAGEDVNIDYVYGLMAGDLLPEIAPGLIGVFIISLLAATTSTCSAVMVTSAGLFTENIYRRFWVGGRSEEHYTWVGRLVSFVTVLVGVYFAFSYTSILEGLEIYWAMQAMMGIVFWAGLYWRGVTVAGAWAGTLAGYALWLFTSELQVFGYVFWDFNERLAPFLPSWMLWEGALYLPWQMIFYLVAGLVATVVVSLMTQRVDGERLDRFYTCLRTPVRPGEPKTEPFTLPEGVEPAPRDPLIGHPDFEIERPSRISVVGFLAASAVAGLILGSFYWIL